jgi:peptidase S41-like protein
MKDKTLPTSVQRPMARSHGDSSRPNRIGWLLILLGCSVVALAQSPPESPAPTPPLSSLDAKVRTEIVEKLAKTLADDYAVAESGEKMAQALRARLAAGAYDKITDPDEFARTLHNDARAVVNDKHLRVMFERGPTPGPGGPMPAPGAAPTPGGAPGGRPPGMPDFRKMNGAIGRVQILPGNVGYIEVNGVPPGANKAIDAAFAFLSNTDALILDLRGNPGGSPQTVAYWMSYLSQGEPHPVMRVQMRNGSVMETQTTDLGDRSYGVAKPVYVLTSYFTFSGGEEFAYDVQQFKRGLIVGETTGGGANPAGPHPLGHGFVAVVPSGLGKHPATGTSWEGVGVKPDIPVAAGLALLEAHGLAVERLKASSTDAREQGTLGAIAASLINEKKARTSVPLRPLSKTQIQLVGAYAPAGGGPGPRFSIVARESHLILQPEGTRPPSRLVYMSADTYQLEGMPDDYTATFFSTPGGEGRVLFQQSNSMPPIVLEKLQR